MTRPALRDLRWFLDLLLRGRDLVEIDDPACFPEAAAVHVSP